MSGEPSAGQTSKFASIQQAPGVEVFALIAAFNADNHPDKQNLSVGAYRTDEGKPWVLPVVRKMEEEMSADHTLNKEYLAITGLESFSNNAVRLLLGEKSKAVTEKRATGIQTLSGTGALRLACDFLRRHGGCDVLYVSQPTWGNHQLIFKYGGYSTCKSYRYWDPVKRGLDLQGMLEDLKAAPENAVVILHCCAHNPTGVDPTREEWAKIADVVKEHRLFPLFDCAYQGFASGDLDNDAWPVRYFVERGFELLAAQSFAKNFGLYNERVGNLTVVTHDAAVSARIKSQVALIVRASYSNPPSHGARIVDRVLSSPTLFRQWKDNIVTMSGRIKDMRSALRSKLEALGMPGSWQHITSQIGMFSYTGLTPPQVELLRDKYHIYLLKNGRINMCGLTSKNLDYVAGAMYDAVTAVHTQ